ncbi:HNH endonuclease [Vibrio crassostreae]|nr:HNH endonuclease [Vibrio crassostreae]ROP14035.1 HNH endonuclease [Vibrio crassostreae]ROQ88122.1 HNH endonuclease [Vibrio crassostreae]RPE94729.1 HNH endonuclease [Vibrio crassostreae]RPF06195.1 HNH endonuclease [Vibrio crassostreae]
MGIGLKTQKMLWGRAASRCAYPDCKMELVMDATQTDDESIVGEACHIVARSADGPRGESPLTSEQRDKYNNLLLLCNVHHKVIDDQSEHYTVEHLRKMKSDHEAWVTSQLASFDAHKQRDDEIYITYIEKLETLVELENWNNWSSWLFGGGQPQITREQIKKLEELKEYIFSRVWPNRYPDLESAFENCRRVIQDLINTFYEHSEDFGKDKLIIAKFYRNYLHQSKERDEAVLAFEEHCYLVEDLALELNRALNYVLDMVRKNILYTYRLELGILYVTSGPNMDFTFSNLRAQYSVIEKSGIPYPGLTEFKDTVRFERDLWFGTKT